LGKADCRCPGCLSCTTAGAAQPLGHCGWT
jgi:hypothetical protein